ncbi:hypothetical protein [Roseobacter sp. MH60115]|uniref:hypothetical protein n=1 Tax=Roseobacter sp. MH60115 TaxID=2785324 RepID=UPI0018A27915|nr:hypothetical protein [Roseobacter sp. MH60115]
MSTKRLFFGMVIIVALIGVSSFELSKRSTAEQLTDPLVAFAMKPAKCAVTMVCRDDHDCSDAQTTLEIDVKKSDENEKYEVSIREGSSHYWINPIPWEENASFFLGMHNEGYTMLVRNADGRMVMTKYFGSTAAVVTSFGVCEAIS